MTINRKPNKKSLTQSCVPKAPKVIPVPKLQKHKELVMKHEGVIQADEVIAKINAIKKVVPADLHKHIYISIETDYEPYSEHPHPQMFIQYLLPENLSEISSFPKASSPIVEELKALRKKYEDNIAALHRDLFTCDSIGLSAFHHLEAQTKAVIEDINQMIENHES